MSLILVIVVIAVCTWGGAKITSNKGRGSGLGMLLGFLLGPIGVLITLFLSDKSPQQAALTPVTQGHVQMYRECPHCKEQMRRDASICPHCRSESSPWVLRDNHWWHQSGSGDWYWLNEAANDWQRFQPPTTEPAAVERADST